MPLSGKYRNAHFSVPLQVFSSNSQRCEDNQILKIRGIVQYFSLFFLSEYLNYIFFPRGQPMCVRDTRLQWEHWAKLIQFLAQMPLASSLVLVLSPASHETKYTICPDPRKIQLTYTIQRIDLFIFPQMETPSSLLLIWGIKENTLTESGETPEPII